MSGKKRVSILEPGVQAPAFDLRALDGGRRGLNEILGKGPALLAFYKSSCPVCQLTLPYLDRMAANPAVQVIAVSQDDEAVTRAFNARFEIGMPTLLDEAKQGYPASNAFGISAVPSLFLVEAGGEVSKAFSGFSRRDMEALGERMGVRPFRPGDNVPEWKAG